jgi:cytochrome oxidase Cu insertion factor (SCO1/SenC/PrrC family)
MQKTSQAMTDTGTPPSPRGRRTLILVALLFLLPVVAATVLYVSGWRPEGKSLQHGELVQPARPVGDAELKTADDAPYRLNALRGKWAFVYFHPLPCTQACRNSLFKMQQVRLAQGRDAARVERVIVVADADAGAGALRELAQQYPGLIAVSGTRAILQALAREFVSSQGTALDVPGRVYLVDPIGNLVLSYAPDADPTGMRKDLARLLRLSQVG